MTDDRLYLIYIKECIEDVNTFVADGREILTSSKLVQAAVLYKLHTLAEATQNLSEMVKNAHPEIDWGAIWGFRNRLVHGYLTTNMDIVWNVIEKYLPPLKLVVDNLLANPSISDNEIKED